MENRIQNKKIRSKDKNSKRTINKDLFKDQTTKKSSLLNKEKTRRGSTIKIKEVKPEEDYSKKIEKLKTILENKNKARIKRKKTFISDSKYKLIVGMFGIAIVKFKLYNI